MSAGEVGPELILAQEGPPLVPLMGHLKKKVVLCWDKRMVLWWKITLWQSKPQSHPQQAQLWQTSLNHCCCGGWCPVW